MNDIQIFNNSDFGQIRTIIIDGEPWFVGVDIAKALGYKKPTGALSTNVDEGDSRREGVCDANGHKQTAIVINESGLYSLIFNSKLDTAKSFKKWVTSEVLPQIRKTGSYNRAVALPKTPTDQIKLLAQGHVELAEKVDAIKSDLDHFKEECPLFPVEAEQIVIAAKRKGVSIMGGKDSEAYHDRSIVQAVYRDMYSQIHREFGLSTYKAIQRGKLKQALSVIDRYELPIVLQEKINNANGQMTLF